MSENAKDFLSVLKEFLSIEHLSAFIMGRNGKKDFEYFANDEEKNKITASLDDDTLKDIAVSFSDYDVSDVTERVLAHGIRCRACAVRLSSGKIHSVLFLFTEGSEDELFDRQTKAVTGSLAGYAEMAEALSKREEKLKNSEADVKSLERSKRLYRYLSMMVDDIGFRVSFGEAADDILKQSAMCVEFDTAMLIKAENGRVKTLKSFGTSKNSRTDIFGGMKKADIPFMDAKTYTISSDSIISEEFTAFFDKTSIKAGVFIPLGDKNSDLYLCYLVLSHDKTWQSDEISFVRQAGAILRAKLDFAEYYTALTEVDDFVKTVFDNSGSAVAVYDAETKESLYRNSLAEILFSDPVNEGMFSRQFLIPGPSDDEEKVTGEFLASGTGDTFHVNMTRAKQRGGIKVLVFMITDITKQKQYQKKLMESADLDDLTGLYNRHRFHLDFETALSDAKRGEGQGTLVLLDLDDFNALNDGLGHVLADKFLKRAAWSIQQMVKKDAQCYRVGSDQFMILVPSSAYDRVKKMIAQIQNRFKKPFSLDGNDYYCTACMGVVNFPQDGEEEDELLSRVDFALHQAKAKGKNQVDMFSSLETSMPPDRLKVEKALREAVADGCKEFLVYYQPVVDITSGESKCCGAEALVRWDSNLLGFMSPDKFIPLAEYLGLIIPIGEHVLLEACRRCRHWNEFGHPEYKVNVNLSVLQLLQKDIVQVITNAIKTTGIDPDNLVLEVTEGMAINDMDKMKEVLEKIHDLGVRLALDDFGTGYSSLSHMKDLPFDELKIDKCFVDDIDKDDYSDAFVRSVSQLADAVNLNVVVEGVERDKQQDVLRDMDVDMIQGFLYDKPLPQDEFEKRWL